MLSPFGPLSCNIVSEVSWTKHVKYEEINHFHMNTFQLAEDIRCTMQRTIQPSKVPTRMKIYASHNYISFQHSKPQFDIRTTKTPNYWGGCSSTSTPNQTNNCSLGMSDTTGLYLGDLGRVTLATPVILPIPTNHNIDLLPLH
jgi:hypothetical protein